MSIIRTEHLKYEYTRQPEEGEAPILDAALRDLSVRIEEGEFVAVLGSNGSGKSTFARQLNALLTPTEGCVWIGEWSTAEEDHLLDIRSRVGMVFQNPDNQIIATQVEEDVGFGPENLGVPTDEIWERVDAAIRAVGLESYRLVDPGKLSGGQKQRVAIAGILAMKPRCIVLDEPTAMLDPQGRQEVLKTLRELNREAGITVILITHYMEETIHADRLLVLDRGELALEGTPREVFARGEDVKKLGIALPQATELAARLREEGLALPEAVLTAEELADCLAALKAGTSGKAAP